MSGDRRPGHRGSSPLRVLADLFRSDDRPEPFELYRRLHEQEPMFRSPLGTFYVTAFDLCRQALRDEALQVEDREIRRVARSQSGADRAGSPFFDSVLFLNAAAHRRVRSVVQSHFTPSSVERLAAGVRRRTRLLLDDLSRAGRFDVYEDFAWPLQLGTLAETLGVPAEHIAAVRQLMPGLVLLGTPTMWSSSVVSTIACEASDDLVSLLRRLVAGVDATEPDGVLSALVGARDRGVLSPTDVMATLCALVVAGVETTVGLVANSVLAILQHPGAARTVAGGLTGKAAEELLRVATPIHVIDRWARVETALGSTRVPAGSHVVLLLGAANRDPARFEHPDALDLERPGGGLGFGGGPHYCLGAPLAKLHTGIAVSELFGAMPALRLVGEPRLSPSINPHSFSRIPVSCGDMVRNRSERNRP